MSPYYYEFTYMLEELGLVLVPALISGIPSGLLGIAGYVLTALALYTIAQRRCIDHAWLAWVPVANLWLLGSLSDQYRYVVRGQIKSKRKVLLLLKVICICLTVSVLAMTIAMVAKGYQSAMYGMRGDRILENLMVPLMVTLGISLPLAGVHIALAVVYYMALYDVYTSCDPDNNVLFLVLSILFSRLTKPLFLLLSRNKDLGMPPRKEEIPWESPPENQFPLDPNAPVSGWDDLEYL